MSGEGRGLGSRRTQQAVRDREIGKPSNSKTCSETADGVTRESEGGRWLSVLRPVRQDQPRGYSGTCLCPVPLKQELAPAEAGGAPGVDGQDFVDIDRRRGAKLATAMVDPPPITPASASPTQAAAPSNPHRRRTASQPPRVPSWEAFGRRPSARADRSRRAGIRNPSPQRTSSFRYRQPDFNTRGEP
jgi:hypothetical protein